MKKTKKLEYREDDLQQELDEDIYSEEGLNDMVEWDEISEEEAGFMMGYMDA